MATVCHAAAVAATEFCPAQLTTISSKSTDAEAKTYYYRLQALASRTVEGDIIADTDGGWFAWIQQPVRLTRTTYMSSSRLAKLWYRVAESAELTVVFPRPVSVRHAWVIVARTHGDHFFNWDARGSVTCEPPDFESFKNPTKMKQERSPEPGDETPAPAPPPANAVVSAMPFTVVKCAKPFVSATVTDPSVPEFPETMYAQFAGVAITEIAVALDPHGMLVDAWVWSRSGYKQIDDSALRAARRSTYQGAVSYCRPVGATYLFRADFSSP